MKKLYRARWYINDNVGNVSGVFVADDKVMSDKVFGSEDGPTEEECEILTDDQDLINTICEFGLVPQGVNPVYCIM